MCEEKEEEMKEEKVEKIAKNGNNIFCVKEQEIAIYKRKPKVKLKNDTKGK